jgi:cleavage and polyadenylation specificity factor subunit 1
MASENLLQIYAYTEDSGLLLIWERSFWATIFAIFQHRVDDFDCLILGCDFCKVVVLAPIAGVDLQEIEFHSFDVEDQTICARHPTRMVIDPQSTCLAMLVQGCQLYFLTLCQANDFAKTARPIISNGQHSGWDYITGGILHNLILDYTPPIHRVRDIVFLEGYNRPTLALMHEPIPTWSTRLPIQRSTVVVKLLSPLLLDRGGRKDLAQENQPTWTSRTLPHNSFAFVAVRPPLCGFLVLSKNAVVYMTHTSGIALGLNSLARADAECPFELTGHASTPCELLSSRPWCSTSVTFYSLWTNTGSEF